MDTEPDDHPAGGLAEQTRDAADQGPRSLLGLRDPELQDFPSRGLHMPGVSSLCPYPGADGPRPQLEKVREGVLKAVVSELCLTGYGEISQRREKQPAGEGEARKTT